MNSEYIEMINKEYDLQLTGISPLHGNRTVLDGYTKIVVKDFGNGLGRVIYVDEKNRLIANNMENI